MTVVDDDKTQFQPATTGQPRAAEPKGVTPPVVAPSYSVEPSALQSTDAPTPSFAASVQPLFSSATDSSNAPQTALQPPGIGDVLKGRFQLVESLGQGGMGMVFKAIDIRKVELKSRNPFIAIKVLNPALARNELLVAGLQRECEKAQELSHPNIITVYDFDRDGDHVFMSMEYLSGRSLSEIIREGGLSGGMKVQKAWPLIQKMGEALAYAHKKNIVHSDFKPANVFVTDSGEVKVLDFGIAARTEKAGDADATVFNARVEGGHTPPYASFEMMNGAKADPRDDIYAFGLVVYELLSGKHPYNRTPASKVFIEQQGASNKFIPVAIKHLSRKQWQLLKSAIEILQDRRPKDLEEWLDQFDPSAKWSPQLIGAIGVVFALGLGFAGNWWLTNQSETESQPAEKEAVQPSPTPIQSTPAPQTISLPVADAGLAIQAKVGEEVRLNAGRSQSGDGQTLSYTWRFSILPAGSASVLRNANSPTPDFVPDKPGAYAAELVVRDGHTNSAPASVAINVDAIQEKPESLHQMTSADGVLTLAASKPQYKIGEDLRLTVHLTKAGFLRVAYVGASGEVSELLPNQYQSTKVKADNEYKIPPRPDKFKLEITGPVGMDRIVAVFSETALPTVENIATSSGELVPELQGQNLSVAEIQYEVLKKK